MEQRGLYNLALVATAGLLGFLFSEFVVNGITFDASAITSSSAQPELAHNAPVLRLETQQQKLGETLTKLNKQQTRLAQDLTALDKKLVQLETQLSRLRLSAGKESNQAGEYTQVKQMISDLDIRLAFLETELESEINNGYAESGTRQAQATGEVQDIEAFRIAEILALDGIFDTEPRDDIWATRREDELSQLLLSNKRIQDGQLFDYECRSTICRLSMQFDSMESRDQAIEIMPVLLNLDDEVSALPIAGTTDVTIYVMN